LLVPVLKSVFIAIITKHVREGNTVFVQKHYLFAPLNVSKVVFNKVMLSSSFSDGNRLSPCTRKRMPKNRHPQVHPKELKISSVKRFSSAEITAAFDEAFHRISEKR